MDSKKTRRTSIADSIRYGIDGNSSTGGLKFKSVNANNIIFRTNFHTRQETQYISQNTHENIKINSQESTKKGNSHMRLESIPSTPFNNRTEQTHHTLSQSRLMTPSELLNNQ